MGLTLALVRARKIKKKKKKSSDPPAVVSWGDEVCRRGPAGPRGAVGQRALHDGGSAATRVPQAVPAPPLQSPQAPRRNGPSGRGPRRPHAHERQPSLSWLKRGSISMSTEQPSLGYAAASPPSHPTRSLHTHGHVCMHTLAHTDMCVHTHAHVDTCMHMSTHVHEHMHAHTCAHTGTCAHIYTHGHTYAHTHILDTTCKGSDIHRKVTAALTHDTGVRHGRESGPGLHGGQQPRACVCGAPGAWSIVCMSPVRTRTLSHAARSRPAPRGDGPGHTQPPGQKSNLCKDLLETGGLACPCLALRTDRVS